MLLKIALTVFAVAWTGRCELLSDCEIGGFLLPNGTCVCHRYWNGEDSKCNRIRCMNGGYSQDETPHCACPSGYLGPHCDPVTLSQAPSSVFEKQSTFNVVVYNAFTDYWGKAGYDHFRQSVKSHLDVFDYAQFNMAIFREGGSDVDQYPSNVTLADKQSFLDQLYAEELSYPMQYACTPLPFYKPLYNFLTKLNTRDTAVTVVTQFPPADDDVHRNMLEELAVAFGIRVNVVFISDETFIRCFHNRENNPQYDHLSNLAFTTGGLFVPQKYGPNDLAEFSDVVLASHYQYQPISFTTSTDCSQGITMSWQGEQMMTYIVVEGANATMSGCEMVRLKGGLASGQQMFNVTSTADRCTVQLSNTNGQCSGKVFAVDYQDVGVRLFSSFVEEINIDSSKYQPATGNPLYLALHAEKNDLKAMMKSVKIEEVTIRMDTGAEEALHVTNRGNAATFEIISDTAFVCNSSAATSWWIEVQLNLVTSSSSSSQLVQRYIPFSCYHDYEDGATTTSVAPTTTPAATSSTSTITTTTTYSTSSLLSSSTSSPTSTSTTQVTTATETSSSIASSMNYTTSSLPASSTTGTLAYTTPTTSPLPSLAPAPINFPIDNPSAFAYGFANTLPKIIYEMFSVTTLNNVNSSFGYFGVVRFEVSNADSVIYHPQKDISSMRNAVYNLYGYGGIAASPESADSQVLEALTSAAESKQLYENSLIVFCIDKLLRTKNYAGFPTIVNKNVKALLLIDKQSFEREVGFSRSAGPLNEVAAATNGHLIVSDQRNQTDFRTLLQFLCTSGPSQSLLFARSIRNGQSPAYLGSVNVAEVTRVVITATTAVAVPAELKDVEMTLNFASLNKGNSIALIYTNNSNFFTATVDLLPGLSKITLSMLDGIGTDVHVRMWIPKTERSLKVRYDDLDMKELKSGPDTVNGAAARITVFGSASQANISLDIRDCSGDSVSLFDASQSQQLTGTGDAYFVPLFCTASNNTDARCAAGTQNKYDVQYFSSDGLSEMRSFICSESGMNNADNCLQRNGEGDVECTGAQEPFYRGPTGRVRDCSNNGRLFFDVVSTSYICQCDPGYSGISCETGLCQQSNDFSEGLDVRYRTYTLVIGVDASNYGLGRVLLNDAAKLTSLKTQPQTVWRYQLMLYCNNKITIPVYTGGSFVDFNMAMKSNLRDFYCSNSTSDQFDLTEVYRSAVRSLGRSVRGIIAFYTEKQSSVRVNVEEFISVSRNYRQELFVFVVVPKGAAIVNYEDFSALRSAVFSSGGNVMFVDSDENNNVPELDVLSEMVSTSTSLALHTNSQLGRVSVTVDPGASGYALLNCRDVSLLKVTTADGKATGPFKVLGRYSAAYKLAGGSTYVLQEIASNDFSVSAVIMDGITPPYVIVDKRTDDASTAFASPNTAVGPSLAFALPFGWKVVNSTNANYRVTSRPTCAFDHNTFTVLPPFSAGANFLTVTLANDATVVNRVMFFGVTSSMECQNGGAEGATSCSCLPEFSSLDCSRPVCEQGELNTWGDACNCDRDSAGGPFCSWREDHHFGRTTK